LALAALPLLAQEEDPKEEAQPVDVAKVLRSSKEFAETCKGFHIEWEEGLVRAVGEVVYRGGGPCEYLVNVAPAKAHETIVLLDPGPWKGEGRPPRERLEGYATCLNSALLCAGFKPGKPFTWDEDTGEVFVPEGPTVHVYMEWKNEKDTTVRSRMSDMLWNYKLLDVMQPGKFVYTGSMMIDEGPPNHKQWFGAEVDRLVVAVLNTSTALIDNVEDGGLDNGAYEAITSRVPEMGTRVTVLFSAKPLDGVTEFEPLELTPEILAERKRRAEERAKAEAEKEKKEDK